MKFTSLMQNFIRNLYTYINLMQLSDLYNLKQ